MSVTTRSVVTIAEVEGYLKRNLEGTAVESVAELIIDLCSGMIEEETERKYGSQDTTLYLDGSGTAILNLPYPITALYGDDDAAKLASLQYRDDTESAWVDVVDDIDLIHFDLIDPTKIELLDGETFPGGSKNIRVRFYAGYGSPPATVRMICLEMVACKWAESGQGESRVGLESQSMSNLGSGGSTSFRDMWADVWKPQLARYKVIQPNVGIINL